MVKYITAFCLLLISVPVCFGQQTSKDVAQSLRQQRAAAAFTSLPDQIKTMDEPALRVFLRLRVATFLWASKAPNDASAAEAIATAAVEDLLAHEGEIPTLYVKSFRRDLLAALQLHAPGAADRLMKQYGLKQDQQEQLGLAFKQLDDKDGVKQAVENVRSNVASGRATGASITFFLLKLEKERPAELLRLLTEIMEIEEQKSGSLTVDALFMIARFYRQQDVPPDLQARFLTAVVRATTDGSGWSDLSQWYAYNLLRSNLPAIEKLRPNLYARASAQLAALTTRLPKQTLEREAVEERVAQSADPLGQLIIEAKATKDSALREELLTEAAQLARKKGQLKLAIDLVTEVNMLEGRRVLWRDQFLGEIVGQALEKKEPSTALYAVAKVQSNLLRSAAMQKLALYFFDANDLAQARETLNVAAKLIEAAENNVDKTVALLRLVPVFAKVDSVRVPELAQTAIKAINNLPHPGREDKADGEAHKRYVKDLLQLAYNIIPVFSALAQKDCDGTFSLASGFQGPELKAAATLGTATGILTASEYTPADGQQD